MSCLRAGCWRSGDAAEEAKACRWAGREAVDKLVMLAVLLNRWCCRQDLSRPRLTRRHLSKQMYDVMSSKYEAERFDHA